MNTYGDIGNATAGWYSRTLLSHATPVIVLEMLGLIKELPPHETKVMQFRRSQPFSPALIPLVEGATPEPSQFGYDTVSVQIQQYGDWSGITDVVQDTSKDRVLRDLVVRQGEQIAETREMLTWDIVRAGTNVSYAGGKSARTGVDESSEMTPQLQRSAIEHMHRQKGRKFVEMLDGSGDYATYPVEACYVAVGHTDLDKHFRELAGTNSKNFHNNFVPVAMYGTGMPLSPHELGKFEETRYISSPDLPAFLGGGDTATSGQQNTHHTSPKPTNAAQTGFDVYPILYFAREAFGVIPLRGSSAVKPMVLNPGVPRATDELGQRGSVGWKMWFACKVLNEAWLRRVEVTAGT